MRKIEENTNTQKKMRRLREKKDISLRQLAEELEVDYTAISYWERGKRTPGKVNAEKLEKFFNLSIGELLEDDPEYERIDHWAGNLNV